MTEKSSKIEGVSCGIFKREIEALVRSGRLDIPFTFIDSMLHMVPAQLEEKLKKTLPKRSGGRKIVLVYGDCQPSMIEMSARPDICRVFGMNCCEILLGKNRYGQLRREGIFFLLPEWTEKWKDVFQLHMGFNRENARNFMKEMHTKLLYLDTGVIPVPYLTLEELSDFCGLPFETMKVDLDQLLKAIIDAKIELAENQ